MCSASLVANLHLHLANRANTENNFEKFNNYGHSMAVYEVTKRKP